MVIDGRAIAEIILENLAYRVHILQKNHQTTPHLAVIRIGDDAATSSYIRQKEKMAKKIGAYVSVYNFPNDISEKKLLESIHFLQQKGAIHAIILQIPIPPHLDPDKLVLAIDPTKDIDGFHPQTKFEVPLALAAMDILHYVFDQEKEKIGSGYDFEKWLKSKTIVIMGKGKAGGGPIITYLQKRGITPTIVDSKTLNPWDITKTADILISAVGKKHVVMENMLKKDVILLGIGMNKDAEGRFYGDYDVEEIKNIASWYTPIPGGMGPVNVAKLMENLVTAAEKSTLVKRQLDKSSL